jgi:hypothetical protein
MAEVSMKHIINLILAREYEEFFFIDIKYTRKISVKENSKLTRIPVLAANVSSDVISSSFR